MKKRLTTAYVLSIISVIPIFLMSVDPLFGERLPEITDFIVFLFGSMNKYNYHQYPINIITLIVFAASLIYAFRGSKRGRLVWLGSIQYLTYVQIVYFTERLMFYTYGGNSDVLARDVFAISNAYILPLVLSIAALIIGLASIKEIKTENRISYDKLANATAIVFIFYLTIVISHLIFLLRIEAILYSKGAESMHLGGQDIANMITLIPLFLYVTIILFRKREFGSIIAPVALLPLTIPVINDDLTRSFGFNVILMIRKLREYFYGCIFENLDTYITSYMSDDPRMSIERIFETTDSLLDEIRLVYLICGVILTILFLKNIKEGPHRS
jgi:hypothetical protein